MPPSLAQRLRRLVLDTGSRRLDFAHPAVRALLLLLALGTATALGAAIWIAWIDSHNTSIAVNDPREIYVNAVRQKIQAATEGAIGMQSRPQLSGSPLLRIQVNPRGELVKAEVARSSGQSALDELALRIVRDAAPFEPFPQDMRRTTNIVEITSEFNFR